jgi:hypothetical protein
MRRIVTFVCVVVVTAAVAAQTPKSPQKPGKWKVTMETEMPGMPMKMPVTTTEVCLTEQDLADPQKSVQSDPKSKCTVSDYKVTGNTVTWSMSCPDQKVTGTGEMTYAAETYTGTIKMKMADREVTQKHSGKWIGPCTK